MLHEGTLFSALLVGALNFSCVASFSLILTSLAQTRFPLFAHLVFHLSWTMLKAEHFTTIWLGPSCI